jgi:hypothetical protein
VLREPQVQILVLKEPTVLLVQQVLKELKVQQVLKGLLDQQDHQI